VPPVPKGGIMDERYGAAKALEMTTMGGQKLAFALRFAGMGIHICPLHLPIILQDEERGICTCQRDWCDSHGKHPHGGAQRKVLGDIEKGEGGFKRPFSTNEQIEDCWNASPWLNIGASLGTEHGLWAMDLDPRHGGTEEVLQQVATDLEIDLSTTPTVRTGGGGWHLYFTPPEGFDLPLKAVHKAEQPYTTGTEFKFGGGGIVLPCSLHPSGNRYEVVKGTWNAGIPVASNALIQYTKDHCIETAESSGGATFNSNTKDLLCGVNEGSRFDRLKAIVIRALRTDDTNPPEILEMIKAWNAHLPQPLADDEVVSHVTGLVGWWAKRKDDLLNEEFTDRGYAQRIQKMYGEDLRWCEQWNSWLTWNGRYWERDECLREQTLAHDVTRMTVARVRATRWKTDDEEKKMVSKALSYENHRNVTATVAALKTIETIAVTPMAFDGPATRLLLNCRNGIVGLRDGTLMEHDRNLMQTMMCGDVDYDPEATCPMWEAFLRKILVDDDMISHLQLIIGCCLRGDNPGQGFYILNGHGKNGKSTIVKVMQHILGSYAAKVNKNLLVNSKTADVSSHSSALSALRGRRFGTASETSVSATLNEDFIKDISSGDRMATRDLYEKQGFIDPHITILLDTNFRPAIERGGFSLWRRLQLVPFEVRITEEEKIDDYDRVLLEKEAPGILRWMVDGSIRLKTNGGMKMETDVPKRVLNATQGYRRDEDKAIRFTADRCILSPFNEISYEDLYSEYRSWCESNGHRAENKTKFVNRLFLEHPGLEPHKREPGMFMLGITTKTKKENDDPDPPFDLTTAFE